MATVRQVKVLQRIAEERQIDLPATLRSRQLPDDPAKLSIDEAGALLTEWNKTPRDPGKVLELPRDRVSANARNAMAAAARKTGADQEDPF